MKDEFKQAISDIRQGWEKSWFIVKAMLSNLQLAKTLNAHRADTDEASAFDIVQAFQHSYRFSRWWFHSYITEQSHQAVFDRIIALSRVLENVGLFNQDNFKTLLTHDFLLTDNARTIFWEKIPARLLTQNVFDNVILFCDGSNLSAEISDYVETLLSSNSNVIPLNPIVHAPPPTPIDNNSPVPASVPAPAAQPQVPSMRHRRLSSTASVLGLLDGEAGNDVVAVEAAQQHSEADETRPHSASNPPPFSPKKRESSNESPEFDLQDWDQVDDEDARDAHVQRTAITQ